MGGQRGQRSFAVDSVLYLGQRMSDWDRPSPTSNSWDVDTRKRRWNLLRSWPLVWSKSTENNRREDSKGLSSGQPTPQGQKSTEAKLKLHNTFITHYIFFCAPTVNSRTFYGC